MEHRAAVIVDTGTQVKSVCVRFREESLTGIEALARANVDPVLHGFAGKGAAVCALCGVGCPAGESCLTCNAEGKFWSYSRSLAGSGSLRTSGVGASSTTVRDGDVEGWRYGQGGTPPFATVEQVCGEEPAATSTTASSSVVVTTAAGGTAPTSPPLGSTLATATTRATGRTTTTTTPPPAVPSTTAVTGAGSGAGDGPAPELQPGAGGTTVAPGLASSPSSEKSPEASRWPGPVLFATMLAGLIGWAGWARRARRRSGGPQA